MPGTSDVGSRKSRVACVEACARTFTHSILLECLRDLSHEKLDHFAPVLPRETGAPPGSVRGMQRQELRGGNIARVHNTEACRAAGRSGTCSRRQACGAGAPASARACSANEHGGRVDLPIDQQALRPHESLILPCCHFAASCISVLMIRLSPPGKVCTVATVR